jgi:hypothetical protein
MAIDYSKAEAQSMPTDKEMEQVVELAREQVRLEKRIKRANQELADLKSELNRVRTEALPEAMKQIGMTEFKLEGGTVISVKDDLNCNIKEENRGAAYAWMREHGHGAIIKDVLTLLFDGEDESKQAAIDYVEALGTEYEVKESIHANTLNAWAKKQLEDGDDPIPEEIINIFRYSVAKVTLPKGKKGKD